MISKFGLNVKKRMGENMKSLNTWAERNDVNYDSPAVVAADEDAAYKPILQGVINTRCTYDGSKIEGSLEE